MGIHCYWAWRRKSLHVNQLSWPPLPSIGYFHGILPRRSLKRINSGLLSPREWAPCCPKDLFKVLADQAALELHIPTTSSLLMRARSSIAPHFVGFSITWRRNLAAMYSRNIMDFLCPSILLLQKILRWLKDSKRTSECGADPVCPQRASSPQPTCSGSR